MKYFHSYRAMLMLAASLLLAACSSDEPGVPDPIESDFEGIVLNIANPNSNSTRGDNTLVGIEGDEGSISSLVVIAYPQNATDKTPIVKDVSEYIPNSKLTNNYVQAPLRLPEDTYHIYVMANVSASNLYKENAQASGDMETYLKNIPEADMVKLNVSALPTGKADAIPMSCHYSAVEYQKSGDTSKSKGAVVIEKQKVTQVYATLIFAMAKVKYTIYNGKIAMLKMASDGSAVQFKNYANRVGLIEHINDPQHSGSLQLSNTMVTDFTNVADEAGKFYKITNVDYPDTGDSAGPSESDYAFTDESENASSTDSKWAYQGIAYVPERLFAETDDESTHTQIKFNFVAADGSTDVSSYSTKTELTFGGEDVIDDPLNPGSSHNGSEANGSATHYGIIRGVIYDVLVYTTKKEITLQVRVRPWAYQKYTWTM